MVALSGGVAALVVGIIGLIIWWKEFFIVLAGSIPILLILGGGLAAYLGIEELKDKQETGSYGTEGTSNVNEELEKLKKERDELKRELEELKKGEEKESE